MDHKAMKNAVDNALAHEVAAYKSQSLYTEIYWGILYALSDECLSFDDRKKAADDITNGLWNLCVRTQRHLALDDLTTEKLFVDLTTRLVRLEKRHQRSSNE